MRLSSAQLRDLKRQGRKITVLTGYDYPTAAAEQESGVEVILVGDSVGSNVLGYASEREVTLADIAHHVRAVRRGAPETHVLADLPFGAYETPESALANAQTLVAAGADSVKLEGPRLAVIVHLVGGGIPVCGHIGLEPQHHERIEIKGKHAADALRIVAEAEAIADAGAFMIVLELIPEELGALVSRRIPIPTIGIGAGRQTDGQVLVVHDMLGIGQRPFRHNRRYDEFGTRMRTAIGRYRDEVRGGQFPGAENASHMAEDALAEVNRSLGGAKAR